MSCGLEFWKHFLGLLLFEIIISSWGRMLNILLRQKGIIIILHQLNASHVPRVEPRLLAAWSPSSLVALWHYTLLSSVYRWGDRGLAWLTNLKRPHSSSMTKLEPNPRPVCLWNLYSQPRCFEGSTGRSPAESTRVNFLSPHPNLEF